MKFHHIGIFVENLENGIEEMSKIVDVSFISHCIEDDLLGVKVKFLKDSAGITYEIVAPFGSISPVTGVLKRGHSFLNHIAYTTNRFDEEVKRLRVEGMVPLGSAKKAKAFCGSRVIFFLTKLGYIIEIIDQEKINDWF